VEAEVSAYDEKISELAEAQRAADRARTEVRRLERELVAMVPDEPRDSSVVLWSGRYNGGQLYRFASIDAGGSWYTTGDTTRQGVTWQQLVGIMRQRSARTYTVLRRDGILTGPREETHDL
jgi:hypothetical protein